MRALLLDTNFSSAPIAIALRAVGFSVVAVGNNPLDCLARSESLWEKLDYSNEEQLFSAYQRIAPDIVVPGCNDLSYTMHVRLCERFGLTSLDSSQSLRRLHDKYEFRRLCGELSLPAPRQWTLSELSELEVLPPLIVKPTDGFSGKGVSVVGTHGAIQLDEAVALARGESRTGTVIIEDYVAGQLCSFSAFIADGEIVADFTVEEFGFTNPFVVDTSYVKRGDRHVPALRRYSQAMIKALGLQRGLLHLQYLDSGEEISLIEATRRCPGDLYSQLIYLSTGFNYAAAYADSFVGSAIATTPNQERIVVRHTVSGQETGTLKNLKFSPGLNLLDWYPLATVGERLMPSPRGRAGVAFCDAEQAQLESLLAAARHNRLIAIEYA